MHNLDSTTNYIAQSGGACHTRELIMLPISQWLQVRPEVSLQCWLMSCVILHRSSFNYLNGPLDLGNTRKASCYPLSSHSEETAWPVDGMMK